MRYIIKQIVKIFRCLFGIHTWGDWYETWESESDNTWNKKEERVCTVCRKIKRRDVQELSFYQ